MSEHSDVAAIMDALVAERGGELSVVELAIVRSMSLALSDGDHRSVRELAALMPKPKTAEPEKRARPDLSKLTIDELKLVEDLLELAQEGRRRSAKRNTKRMRAAMEAAVLCERIAEGSAPPARAMIAEDPGARWPGRIRHLMRKIVAGTDIELFFEDRSMPPKPLPAARIVRLVN